MDVCALQLLLFYRCFCLCIFREMVECFNQVSDDTECRAVVLSGAGKALTAGMYM